MTKQLSPAVLAAIEAAREKYKTQPAAHQAQAPAPAQIQTTAPVLTRGLDYSTFLPPGITQLDQDQQSALELGLRGQSFCLVGAAGSGKTTTTQILHKCLQQANHISPLQESTKYLRKGLPAILIVGFTNKAIANILKRIEGALRDHCLTIHKTVEYGPEWYEIMDPETGISKTMMRFVPYRNAGNPLPQVSTIFFEESSQIGLDLYQTLMDALPSVPQCVFLGDLNQLPPVMGVSILAKMLTALPIVELRTVYRQAQLSPIISLATAIRQNKAGETGAAREILMPTAPQKIVDERGEHGTVTITQYKTRIGPEAVRDFLFKKIIPQWIDSGFYDPEQAQILCPFEKGAGINCPELNAIVGTALAHRAGRKVYEVIARYTKNYFSIGDKILYKAMEGRIVDIYRTPGYSGVMPRDESTTMDFWGHDPKQLPPPGDEVFSHLTIDSDAEAKNLASHTLKIQLDDLEEPLLLNTAGEINSLFHGWAMTVHKSQGSEWRDVFVILHASHNTMLFRELIYTAVTRARQNLHIFCEGDMPDGRENSIKFAAARPRILGETLADKLEFLKTKLGAERER